MEIYDEVDKPRILLRMGKCLVDTWLNNRLTATLMQISPPGFRSGPEGIAVAKKYEDMSTLLGIGVLNQIGPLNHPSP